MWERNELISRCTKSILGQFQIPTLLKNCRTTFIFVPSFLYLKAIVNKYYESQG
jgi:hypothetical protein